MIREVEFDLGLTDGGFADLNATPRPPGEHGTDYIRTLYNRLFPDKARTAYEEMSDSEQKELDGYREMGFMWEDVFTRVFRERQFPRRKAANDALILQEPVYACEHAVQIKLRACPHGCREGVWFSPDAVDTSHPLTLEEYKWTSRSASRVANLEVDFWDWVTQIKIYCCVLGLRQARLFVLFSRGDYGKRRSPWPRRFDMDWTDHELAQTWKMWLQERQRVLKSS